MPTITIHNLSAETHCALQAQAKAAGRSTEAEVRHLWNLQFEKASH